MECDFSKLVRDRITDVGMSQADLAKALTGTVTKAALYSFLKGESGLNSKRLAKVFEVLAIEVRPKPRPETPDRHLDTTDLLKRARDYLLTANDEQRKVYLMWRAGQCIAEARHQCGGDWPEVWDAHAPQFVDARLMQYAEGALLMADKCKGEYEIRKFHKLGDALTNYEITKEKVNGKYIRRVRR